MYNAVSLKFRGRTGRFWQSYIGLIQLNKQLVELKNSGYNLGVTFKIHISTSVFS